VEVGWRTNARSVEVFIRDQGPGLLNSDNLFVPFFSTAAAALD
jgi:C4-dicarboxylate-specific signal transduction histidine kinase